MRFVFVLALAACGPPPKPAPVPPPPPPAVPASLVTYMRDQGWGAMHLEWHTVRRWDRLPPSAVAYAERQGWVRAPRQEGDAGNGLEFLAMHREMMRLLAAREPKAQRFFVGWTAPPTDPRDPADPVANGAAFAPEMLAALDRVEHHLETFPTEDALGLYIETSFKTDDRTAGVHNYLHNRFQDPASPIDMGNPSVNLLNPQFWRLHGWIDHVWTAYRARAKLRDDDPAYVNAMSAAKSAMTMKMKGVARSEPPPAELIDAVRP